KWNAATGKGYWRQPPRDVAAFARFMSAAVARYRGVVHSWELWNEPDNADYWAGSVEQYAQLVRAGAAAVRSADPSAKIVLGGISWNVAFLRQLFRDQHIGGAIDIVNLHSYYETWIPDPLERLPEYVGRVHDLIARYGQGQTIWAAEIGYSDYRRGRSVSADNEARFEYEHTPAYQADDLFRALTLLRAGGEVSLATWYRINDLPVTQDVIGDVNNRHLGVVTTTGQAKPALVALQEFQHLLGGPLRVIDNQSWVRRLAGSDAEVHCFGRADGDVIAVLWLRTEVAGSEQSSTSGGDPRQEQVQVTVPMPFARASQCDLLDPAWQPLPIDATDGLTTVSITHLHGGRTRVVRFSQR
ncbi:MAG TPA: hypothetical protein VLI90_18870, partial [Tepidisphaeraceae bacterium]|nr:hypothetical protein [Tepidisphaeraceae bacterium]